MFFTVSHIRQPNSNLGLHNWIDTKIDEAAEKKTLVSEEKYRHNDQ